MKLKIVAAVMACISVLPLQAYAAYPSSGGVVNFDEMYNISGTQSWVPSPAGNIFKVDGKSFILLDTDAEGNYFVLTEEHYGTYPFEKGIVNKPEIQTAVTENGKTTFTDKGADLTDTDSWRFNPQRETNIAYWLNNGFITEGNTAQHVFPKRVYDHIIEKNWSTEGFKAYRGWTAAQYYDQALGVNNAADFAAAYTGNEYEVTAKIALLSYAEYMQYKDKIGVCFNNGGGWSGMMLRTCDALFTASVSGNTRTLSLTRSPLMVRTKNADKSENGNLITAYADAISADNYYIRPCFWLSKDFFKEVPCELEWDSAGNASIGSYPLEKIKQHTYSELKTIYTDGQLESLGMETLKRDWYNYPAHSGEVKDLKAGEGGGTGIEAYYQSPEENLFSADGRSFILLDKDKDGNYFVMANEEYGQRIFSECSFADSKALKESDWYFNPSDKNSIAYWLNNDFLTKGNKFKGGTEVFILPQSVRDSMIEHDWEIEPHYPINGWTVNSYASAAMKEEIEAWRNSQIEAAQKRTVRCKTALMSFTEYMQYKDKIGLTALAGGYAGFSLRTPRSQTNAAADGKSWSVIVGQLQVANSESQNKMVFSTCSAGNDIYYVRPVFWLSKDFFSKNALDLELMGENVKNEISSAYDYYDMRQIYSAEQMRELGINPERGGTDAVPAAQNVIIEGALYTGNNLFGGYKYISNDNSSAAAAERNSEYRWYISDTPEGVKKICSQERTYTPGAQDAGKYICFGVTPKNAFGILAEKEYLSRSVLVLPSENTELKKVTFTNEYEDEIDNLNGAKSVSAHFALASDSECIVFLAAYTAEGKLIGMSSDRMAAGTNEKTLTVSNIETGGGAYARLIIFKADDLAAPCCAAKL